MSTREGGPREPKAGMIVITRWTGRETRALREARRQTVEEFAAWLGVSARTISKWEALRGSATPRPSFQDLLDAALARCDESVRTRFLGRLRGAAPTAGHLLPLDMALRLNGDVAILLDAGAPAVVVRTEAYQLTISPGSYGAGRVDSWRSLERVRSLAEALAELHRRTKSAWMSSVPDSRPPRDNDLDG